MGSGTETAKMEDGKGRGGGRGGHAPDGVFAGFDVDGGCVLEAPPTDIRDHFLGARSVAFSPCGLLAVRFRRFSVHLPTPRRILSAQTVARGRLRFGQNEAILILREQTVARAETENMTMAACCFDLDT